MLVVLCMLIAYAAGRPQPARPPVQLTKPPAPTPTSTQTPAQPPSDPPQQPDLAEAIAAIEQSYHVSIGLGIAPIAAPGQVTTAPWLGGTLATALAWQTIDIPIGQAVSQGQRQPQELDYLLDRAITQNSLAGDEALWQFLGTPDQAVASTKAVLAASGDSTTEIPSDSANTLQPFAVFSQVWWTQADAAQFMGAFYCMNRSWPVLWHMTTDPANDFGLASLQPSLVRTSYGVADNSLYRGTTVRQVGLLWLPDAGMVGVSLAAAPDDGTLATAQAAMTSVASLLPSVTGFDGHC